MVDRGEALQPRPGGPDRGELRGAAAAPAAPAAAGRRTRSFSRLRGCCACASAAEKSSGRMHDDVEPHPGVAEAAEFGAEPFVAARLRRPGCAGTFTCPGTASILPARRGIQKAWMTSRLVTTMSTGTPAGRCSTPFGLSAAMLGIAEGPAPLPAFGLDPRRRAVPAAAEAARRRPAHRRPAAAARRPAGTRPPSTIQRCGDTPEPQPGRRITSAKRTITSTKSTAEPASITHHSVAIDAAAGPEGSSVDSGPAAAGQRRGRSELDRRAQDCYDPARTTCIRREGGRRMAKRRTIPATQPESPVMLELHPARYRLGGRPGRASDPRDDGAFPDRVRDRDPRRRRLLLVVGRRVLGAGRPLVGRHGLLDRRRGEHRRHRPSCCWCAASGCWRRAGRMPWRR